MLLRTTSVLVLLLVPSGAQEIRLQAGGAEYPAINFVHADQTTVVASIVTDDSSVLSLHTGSPLRARLNVTSDGTVTVDATLAAADVRIHGSTTTVADLLQIVAQQASEIATLKSQVQLMWCDSHHGWSSPECTPPSPPPAPPSPPPPPELWAMGIGPESCTDTCSRQPGGPWLCEDSFLRSAFDPYMARCVSGSCYEVDSAPSDFPALMSGLGVECDSYDVSSSPDFPAQIVHGPTHLYYPNTTKCSTGHINQNGDRNCARTGAVLPDIGWTQHRLCVCTM